MLSAAAIKARAQSLGFDLCGIAPAAAFPELTALADWLERGYAGEMTYLARSADRRMDARRLLPAARSIIVTGSLYHVDRAYSTERADPGRAEIARYAWGDDYHERIGARLDALLAWMREAASEPFEARTAVDTAPVQERVYAQHAGIGWIGKNTCVINARLGSWLLLGEILCSLALEVDPPALDQCGHCALCLEACPTGALVAPAVLDATRCIAYLTIELRGAMPVPLRTATGSHVFGCDVCQEVCPWNARSPTSADAGWQPRPFWDLPRAADLWNASDAELAAARRGSAIRRTSVAGLRRNLAVAIGNSGDPASLEALSRSSAGAPSIDDPMVRAHVEWAASRR